MLYDQQKKNLRTVSLNKIVKKFCEIKLKQNTVKNTPISRKRQSKKEKNIRDINLHRKKSIPIRDNRDIINSI